LFAQISSTKTETKDEIQRQLQLSRQETEVIRGIVIVLVTCHGLTVPLQAS
jgi:hypothetical protein